MPEIFLKLSFKKNLPPFLSNLSIPKELYGTLILLPFKLILLKSEKSLNNKKKIFSIKVFVLENNDIIQINYQITVYMVPLQIGNAPF